MTHYDLPQNTNFNFSSGIDQLFLYVADQVPLFFPMVLIAFFTVITIGGMFAEKRQKGEDNFFKWASVGSALTMALATIFAITSGLINGLTLTITAVFTIIFFSAYAFFSR